VGAEARQAELLAVVTGEDESHGFGWVGVSFLGLGFWFESGWDRKG
jgi:LPXTG-motif cell wall-anchored protein